MIERYQVPENMRDAARTELCTSQHPNHKVIGQVYGSPLFWQAWCSICDMSSETPNPYMEADYLAEANAWAVTDETGKKRRRANRGRKKEKRCPHCNGVL